MILVYFEDLFRFLYKKKEVHKQIKEKNNNKKSENFH